MAFGRTGLPNWQEMTFQHSLAMRQFLLIRAAKLAENR
jgi:hypothetical protein